ncbi:hypothetical protein CLAFUW4_04083 [Fulvia fulva]|uniref:Glycoside hydrolase family 31 TIM barrel domain-containing protein n=1 Tax=Passalora fulva TaxID=5499 RepID=A0A9Q8LG22_PASFU|nr:uncharacterized protein CLAFUR5_04046 [Fulvia fulva]KAK4626740.1 hypothetical protein CLAFUR4_04069 [Fulvia fulva]KAK4628626.1 hypothetical protein CLAFUR0_04070 [Fulvia fulva]UJO16792.1 hypothetical protein CLAFUR5_04046 [Fulvia fulva]WPV13499.1 hypothetical protein CLAFUW4_04083 [Fulvia fulva]WPV28250.1 hypothetical protein CLAFUW7_04072 [Fulvia fulva]
MLTQDGQRLVFRYDDHTYWVEPWGPNAFHVRATRLPEMPSGDYAALAPTPPDASSNSAIRLPESTAGEATITNGSIRAEISHRGKITMYNAQSGKKLLEEYARHRLDLHDPKCSALMVQARELRGIQGTSDFNTTLRLESVDPDERLYGMGQYQHPYLNLKGADIELAQRNSQASVPFAVSPLGYGFLWNNPAIGRAVLGRNVMSFESFSAKSIDYWIVAGDEPREIVEAYANVTGKVPMMPEYGLGFWQCKLRYPTQEELLGVAGEYKSRKIPLDVIVIDFFH